MKNLTKIPRASEWHMLCHSDWSEAEWRI